MCSVGAGPPGCAKQQVAGTPRPFPKVGPQVSRAVAEGGRPSCLLCWGAVRGAIQPAQALAPGTLPVGVIASGGLPTHAPSFALVIDGAGARGGGGGEGGALQQP